ncbi:MAG: hypothetical protein LBU79_04730 [Planctomycetota bacterium]|nr:hypothetical protein [Planctomycetota bacterium]
MPNHFFPPSGPQDKKRATALSDGDRDYMLFSLEFTACILRERPSHPEALLLAANYLTELGFYVDGLKIDRLLVALKPNDPQVLYNLACSLSLNSLLNEAFEVIHQAWANGFTNLELLRHDRDLELLRHDPRFHSLLSQLSPDKLPQ